MTDQTEIALSPELDAARREFAAAWLTYQQRHEEAADAHYAFEKAHAGLLQAEREAKASYERADDTLRETVITAFNRGETFAPGIAIRQIEQVTFDSAELVEALIIADALELLAPASTFSKWALKANRYPARDEVTGEIVLAPYYGSLRLPARIISRPTPVITPVSIVHGLREAEYNAQHEAQMESAS